MDRIIELKEIQEKTNRVMTILKAESVFPIQNALRIEGRITESILAGKPMSFGCFSCLPIDLENKDNSPIYSVGDWKTRLERSKIVKRFFEIAEKIDKAKVSASFQFVVADTDIYDIYGKWLKNFDLTLPLKDFERKMDGIYSRQNFSVSLWSGFQSNFESAYVANFETIRNDITNYVEPDYLQTSYNKRLAYFTQKGFIVDENIAKIAFETAVSNVALYGAQGPIIDKVFDCLVIADPDPLRMGKIQSILTPELAIIYPVKD